MGMVSGSSQVQERLCYDSDIYPRFGWGNWAFGRMGSSRRVTAVFVFDHSFGTDLGLGSIACSLCGNMYNC